LPESNGLSCTSLAKRIFFEVQEGLRTFLDLFFSRSSRAGGIFLLSVSKSDESAKTNRNVFQEVTYYDKKIEQTLNMFQKRTQQTKK